MACWRPHCFAKSLNSLEVNCGPPSVLLYGIRMSRGQLCDCCPSFHRYDLWPVRVAVYKDEVLMTGVGTKVASHFLEWSGWWCFGDHWFLGQERVTLASRHRAGLFPLSEPHPGGNHGVGLVPRGVVWPGLGVDSCARTCQYLLNRFWRWSGNPL